MKRLSEYHQLKRFIMAAMLLALALVLPFVTGQIPQIGAALCPMHLPVLLCGFFCGPVYALAVGLLAPLMRFVLFGMPPLFPSGIGMCVELSGYGVTAGVLYAATKNMKREPVRVCVSLIGAMIVGRVLWGLARLLLAGIAGSTFTYAAFIAGAFTNAIPGIIAQLVLVPLLVLKLKIPGGK